VQTFSPSLSFFVSPSSMLPPRLLINPLHFRTNYVLLRSLLPALRFHATVHARRNINNASKKVKAGTRGPGLLVKELSDNAS
jgi:hypothetical protein